MNMNDSSDIRDWNFNHYKFSPIIGIGYWKDEYNNIDLGSSIFTGYTINIIIPFFRFQISRVVQVIKNNDDNGKGD